MLTSSYQPIGKALAHGVPSQIAAAVMSRHSQPLTHQIRTANGCLLQKLQDLSDISLGRPGDLQAVTRQQLCGLHVWLCGQTQAEEPDKFMTFQIQSASLQVYYYYQLQLTELLPSSDH